MLEGLDFAEPSRSKEWGPHAPDMAMLGLGCRSDEAAWVRADLHRHKGVVAGLEEHAPNRRDYLNRAVRLATYQ